MNRIGITTIRTSTVLIQTAGRTLITDPWFSMRMRFLPVLRRPGVPLAAVPQPDVILYSHLHADHYEPFALKRLCGANTVVLAPPGSVRHLPRNLRAQVIELAPDSHATVHGLTIHAFHVEHTFPPPDEVAFLIQGPDGSIFFGGDAAYSPVFAEIGRNHNVDLALLPVGGSLIWGKRTVMSPDEAVRAAEELNARYLVPIHPGGDWPALPPMSRHPGTAEQALRYAQDQDSPVQVLPLPPGKLSLFSFSQGAPSGWAPSHIEP